MKPLKLVMTAFGPYCGEEIVEFDRLGEQGIFLITGDTGAGKTTIFDAIAFALYGEPSGVTREQSMMRSDFAPNDVRTAVKFTFAYRGELYTVERKLKHYRPNRKTPEEPYAEFLCHGKTPIIGVGKVTEAVVNLLGIDRNQFSQIVMIAQGDFLKIILSDTDEKGKILGKIFNTGIYEKIQIKLKAYAAKLKSEKELCENAVKQYICQIICDGTDEDSTKLRDLKDSESALYNIDLIVKLLEKMNIDGENAKNMYFAKSEELEHKITEISGKILLAREAMKLKSEIKEKQYLLEQNQKNFAQAEQKYNLAKQNAPLSEALQEKIFGIQSQLETYSRIDELNRKLETFVADKNDKTAKLNVAEISYKECLAENNRITEEFNKLENIEVIVEQKKSEYENIVKQGKIVKNASDKITELNSLNKSVQSYEKNVLNCEAELDEKTKKYIQTERIFLHNQAGLMAKKLQEGIACPVCGSLSHPCPAEVSYKTVTEADVKTAKTSVDTASEALHENTLKLAELKKECEMCENSLLELCTEIFGEYHTENLYQQIQDKLGNLRTEVAECEAELESAKKLKEEKNQYRQLIQQKSQVLKKTEDDMLLLREQIKKTESECEKYTALINDKRRGLAFDNRKDATECLKRIQEEKDGIDKNITDAKSELDTYAATTEKIIASLEALKGRLNEESWDLDKLDEERERASAEKAETRKNYDNILTKLETNCNLLKLIKSSYEEIKRKDEEYLTVSDLSNTANGTLPQKPKIDLQAYVQAFFFEKVIAEANKRLSYMTSGRYLLVRKSEVSDRRIRTGLELDVMDYNTGKQRSVKTLSGGEAFKASLSMALGLSDVIQMSNGGIKIESMFIDEGFGSLDSQSLDAAVNILNGLTDGNRIVGIISHVSELRDRIERKLVVKKGRNGSTTEMI